MWQKSTSVDQHSAARYDRIAARISAARDIFRRQGAIVTTWRTRGARKLGPYFRLAYRADGRQQSIYLGACTKLVARVRALLADLQAVIRRHRAYRVTRRELRTALRRQKAECDAVLRAHGFTPRGYDLRGFRRLAFLLKMQAAAAPVATSPNSQKAVVRPGMGMG